MKTKLSIEGEKFLINGKLVYSEIPGNSADVHGLLMNARFIQGIFDDKADPKRFARFGWRAWDPRRHTEDLIKALPLWYSYGLRAITVGFQGGMPVFTIDNASIDNNPFSEDGTAIDPAYLERMESIFRAADDLGMAVIVSILYQGQINRLQDGLAVRNAIRSACRWLKDQGFSNVIIEVANEYGVGNFRMRPLLSDPESISGLIELAREHSGGLPVGCSGAGMVMHSEVARASDVILIHGNGAHREQYSRFVKKVKSWNLAKPILCNEDSPCITNLDVAFDTKTSWGYYNNLSKQEPPADWTIANAEDLFFARRMARGLGFPLPSLPEEEQYVLDGLSCRHEYQGTRWVRLSAEYPETINYVDFIQNGNLAGRSYQEPFYLNSEETWIQGGSPTKKGDTWRALVHLADGRTLEREVVVG